MQPQIGYWNLFCLAQALVPLLGPQYDETVRNDKIIEDAQRVLEGFRDRFAPALEQRMRAKLGLAEIRDGDDELANRLFEVMNANRADFTLTFRNLAKLRKADASGDAPARDLFLDRAAFDVWANDYRQRLSEETRTDEDRAAAMNAVNPKFVLRNHLPKTPSASRKKRIFRKSNGWHACCAIPSVNNPNSKPMPACRLTGRAIWKSVVLPETAPKYLSRISKPLYRSGDKR